MESKKQIAIIGERTSLVDELLSEMDAEGLLDDEVQLKECHGGVPTGPGLIEIIKPYMLTSYDMIGMGASHTPIVRDEPKIRRNDLCPCESGEKYKKCCINK